MEKDKWYKLTPELITNISQERDRKYWVAISGIAEVQIGQYEWVQGRNPDGFNVDGYGRFGVNGLYGVTHIMIFTKPEQPTEDKL